MRVLVVPKEFPSAQNPQAGIFVLRRIQALRALGHDLEVLRIVPQAPPFGKKWHAYRAIPASEEIEGIRVHAVRAPIPPRMLGMEYLPLLLGPALRHRIAAFQPDVLHASFLIPCGQLVARSPLPSIITAHGVDAYDWPHRRPGLYRAAKEAITKATRVTGVSRYIADCVRAIVPREVDVVWNGGDERFFYPQERNAAREKAGISTGRCVVAYAGNVLRAKGLYDLLDASHRMSAEERPLLAIAGAGPDLPDLVERARALRIDVRWCGRLDQNGVANLFAAADIVTLPSYKEGLPNVVCEAMLCRRAVLATTVGGIPEVVTDGETGMLVAPGNVEQLAVALRKLCADPGLRNRLADAAQRYAAERLTWRVAAQGYDRIYREALEASGRRARQLPFLPRWEHP